MIARTDNYQIGMDAMRDAVASCYEYLDHVINYRGPGRGPMCPPVDYFDAAWTQWERGHTLTVFPHDNK